MEATASRGPSDDCCRPWATHMVEPDRKDQNTIAFLRMAATQLRQLAEHAPDIASELRHMASQLEAEADDLAGGDG
jgi:hypothetical protein